MTVRFYYLSLLILVLFKIVAVYFTGFGLYGDEAQYWLWSQSPNLGYFSKPPLLPWFLLAHETVFGNSFFSLKMFPLVIYFFIYFSFYNFCLKLSMSRDRSVVCAISFLIIPAASVSSFLISTDLVLLLFWTISMTLLIEIRGSGKILSFFLLGVFLGLTFMAKYAAVYFLLCLVFLIILDKKTFRSFKNNSLGVVIFLTTLILILLPNIIWNLNNEWVTLSHTSDNANFKNLNLNFYEPFVFTIAQILMVGPVLFLSFVFLIKYYTVDFENKFLLIFSLPIIFIVLVESFLVRANANWAAPALISLFVLFFRLTDNKKSILIKINFISNYIFAVILFSFILVSSKLGVFDRIRGIEEFSKELTELIKNKDLVISDRIIFSNVSYEIREKPNKIYMPYKVGEPITNHFQMSSFLDEKYNKGFFLIGKLGDVSYLSKGHKGLLVKEFDVPFNSSKLELYEISFK